MQDAPRKFRAPSQSDAGAWTGTIFRITEGRTTKSVSVVKWENGQAMLRALRAECEAHANHRPNLDRKQLEKDTGFLNHLAMTFDETTPFLKGFYLTLNSYRLERGVITGEDASAELNDSSAPKNVVASPRLYGDVKALIAILKGDSPPLVQIRSRRIACRYRWFMVSETHQERGWEPRLHAERGLLFELESGVRWKRMNLRIGKNLPMLSSRWKKKEI